MTERYLMHQNFPKDVIFKITVQQDEFAENPMGFELEGEGMKKGLIINTRAFSYSSLASEGIKTLEALDAEFEKIAREKGIKVDSSENVIATANKCGYRMLPVWGYSHGDIQFAASETNPYDKWDSGFAGVIWIEWNSEDDKNEAKGAYTSQGYFDLMMNELNLWLSGDVYCAEVCDIRHPEKTEWVSPIYFTHAYPDKNQLLQYLMYELGIGGKIVDYDDSIVTNVEVIDTVKKLLDHTNHEFVEPEIWGKLQEIVASSEEKEVK